MQCTECGKVFSTKFNLSRHVLEHSSSNPTHVCCKCGKAFKRKEHLRQHMRNRHEEKVCHLCTELLFLDDFIQFVSECCWLQVYKCSLCDEQFPLKEQLSQHRKTSHLPERTHVCDDCGKTFSRATSLRRHVKRTHSSLGSREFRCLQCKGESATFSSVTDLNEHSRRVHGTGRDFSLNCLMTYSVLQILVLFL